jgi:hypothetical protein
VNDEFARVDRDPAVHEPAGKRKRPPFGSRRWILNRARRIVEVLAMLLPRHEPAQHPLVRQTFSRHDIDVPVTLRIALAIGEHVAIAGGGASHRAPADTLVT